MASRYRVKGVKYVSKPGYVLYPIPPNKVGMDAATVADFQPRAHSEMSDITFSRGWNPCDHFRISLTGGKRSAVCPLWSTSTPYPNNVRAAKREVFARMVPTVMSLHRDAAYDDWKYHAFNSMIAQFPSEMSLANSLWELKNGVKEFLPTMEDLRQSAAGNFLKLKFGIMPFLEDLKDSMNVWGKFQKRLSFIENGRGKTYTEHRKFSAATESPSQLYTEDDYLYTLLYSKPGRPYIAHSMRCEYNPGYTESKFWLTGLISNEVGDMSSLYRQADAFGRVLGLGNSPKIIWKATKWTWLFDWFVDTNKILDKFEDKGPFEGKLSMIGCFEGAKHKHYGNITFGCVHTDEGLIGRQSDGDYLLRVYERRTGITPEDLDSSLVQPSLTGDQQQILLALLIQRTRAVPDWESLWSKLRHGGRIP